MGGGIGESNGRGEWTGKVSESKSGQIGDSDGWGKYIILWTDICICNYSSC